MHPHIEIRHEIPADFSWVHDVVATAFGSRLEADLVEALRTSADPQLSLVALIDDEIVGHIFFSPVTIASERPAPPVAQLSPLAVAPSHQGKGVGTALVRAGLEHCPVVGWWAVFLLGSPRYYGRFGFELAEPRGFSQGAHDAYLQLREAEPGVLNGIRGRIQLHPAFAQVGAE